MGYRGGQLLVATVDGAKTAQHLSALTVLQQGEGRGEGVTGE